MSVSLGVLSSDTTFRWDLQGRSGRGAADDLLTHRTHNTSGQGGGYHSGSNSAHVHVVWTFYGFFNQSQTQYDNVVVEKKC